MRPPRPIARVTVDRLGVPTRQTARALIRLYCRFWGEIRAHDLGRPTRYTRAEARAGMRRCRDAILLLGVNFDPSALRPRMTVPKRRVLGHGEIRGGALVILKAARGWVETRRIADELLARHGVVLPAPAARDFRQKVREALNVLAEKRLVERERVPSPYNDCQRWRLVTKSA